MANLRLINITKFFGTVPAVSDVNLEVTDGEFIVLVGPSGCGKSTLLRLIAGLETDHAGEIIIDGNNINHVPPKNRDIAMVFQNYALYPHMTVYQNMAFGLKMRKISKEEIDNRVLEAAKILKLQDLLNRKSKALSGGQQQRVALGRAIVRKPKLFLFDEPLSNLDAKLRVAMRGELIKLHKKLGTTMIYVTHDQVEAMSMGDRLVVLHEGKVQQIGKPLGIYEHPANLFVAGFIGSPPMNLFHCKIRKDAQRFTIVTDDFELTLPDTFLQVIKSSNLPDNRVILGVRPEDIHEMRPEICPPLKQQISARIEYIEPLGSEVFATCTSGKHEFIVRFSAKTDIHPDQKIKLVIDMERSCFFHPTKENELTMNNNESGDLS